MKKFLTHVTEMTLVDAIVVLKALPQNEIEQIEAFSGVEFDVETMAMQLMNQNGPKWTCRIIETREPLVVAGFIQIGTTIWRSFMLANERAWAEFGFEVTIHARKAVRLVVKDQEHVRLETVCLATRKTAQEWYPKIGLAYESTLLGYGVNGESAVLYTLTKGARNY
jgi:hypothetical protein